MISGILASPGIAFGKALLLKEDENCHRPEENFCR